MYSNTVLQLRVLPVNVTMVDIDIDVVVGELFPNVTLKDKQRRCLEHIVAKDTDLIAVLPTGYGKSLIYQVGIF